MLIDGIAGKDLHFHWDNDLVVQPSSGVSLNTFASNLKAAIPVDMNWNGQGQFLTWAKQWASGTDKQSADHAYNLVSITGPIGGDDPEKNTKFAITLVKNVWGVTKTSIQ